MLTLKCENKLDVATNKITNILANDKIASTFDKKL